MFRPLYDRVLVKRDVASLKSAGGIHLPERAREELQTGIVLAIGPGARNHYGDLVPLSVKVGDRVSFTRYAGDKITTMEENTLVMNERDILGVMEEEDDS